MWNTASADATDVGTVAASTAAPVAAVAASACGSRRVAPVAPVPPGSPTSTTSSPRCSVGAQGPVPARVLAQAAAVASLEAFDELDVRVKELVAERGRVVAALAEQGWAVPETDANFVWLPVGERTPDLVAACQAAGLTVRPYGDDGVRVTIAEPEANDRFLEVTAAFPRD